MTAQTKSPVWRPASRLKDSTGLKVEITGAGILEGELGDQGDYFVGLCLNVGRPSLQANHIVLRVQRLFAARHINSTDGHSSNFLKDDLDRRRCFCLWHGLLSQ
jgi:hypothetical protein